jgi:hypothetical protein
MAHWATRLPDAKPPLLQQFGALTAPNFIHIGRRLDAYLIRVENRTSLVSAGTRNEDI